MVCKGDGLSATPSLRVQGLRKGSERMAQRKGMGWELQILLEQADFSGIL